ncbi:hypothetical protein M2459_001326 [Parabacteroides sp. PF5-5]|uniref:PepSY-associated TM helix domain-containing protein n=1 Tax=unclassified Parabacteroides TaxID=2649774 RepID=UPI002472F460|nr:MULTISPECIES: PepSY-associated TM helix domain-containing protein [unclassified Parabacteroides]MDH6304591.1 hypothetical protein [Parabacteroides sp. PH5-39]MDH6315796.1 hypothetical protein [Parabacteroides sp. PF5-13]MDH6319455.1 hypothetical protein [Parabacteroides sp. PH5-13]MDH6323186.1 hypothetical protein [Parabacteroides sp. PH5-8]MDH6326988.1 hypothetical protein [Parabacteroides sp. PH5-41]
MKWSIDSKGLVRWLRILHRDIGFLAVGLCLVYAISGILLNHLDGTDPAFKTRSGTLSFPPELDNEALTQQWNRHETLPPAKKVMPVDEAHVRIFFEGGIGVYNLPLGTVEYETYTKRPFIYWINKLHYNLVKGWTPVADIFSIVLIFLAISGLFLTKGKKGLAGSGKWYLLAGLLIPIIYILFI